MRFAGSALVTILLPTASAALPLTSAAHVSQRKAPPPTVYAHLAFSAEMMFREITVRGRTITWRHNVRNSWMDEQEKKAAEESRRTGRHIMPPMIQAPWWTDADIKTDTAMLTSAETASLSAAIRRSRFLKLAAKYPVRGREYPTTISVAIGSQPVKTVVYESGYGARREPAAFAAMEKRLFTLTAAHFPAFGKS